MIKSRKYKGIWLNKLADNDISFFIQFRDENKVNRKVKIGKKSEGVNESICFSKRCEIIHKVRLGDSGLNQQVDAPTFDVQAQKYFNFLFENGRRKENTESTIKKYSMHVKPYLGNRSILKIDAEILTKLKKDKIKYQAPRTVNGYLSLVSTIINYTNRTTDLQVKNHIATKNVVLFKEDNIRERYLSKSEINILLENVKPYRQVNLATRFALSTGARLGTILSIKVKHIDTYTRVIHLIDHKNSTTFSSYLHKKYFPNFDFLKDKKANEFIFEYKGHPIEGASIQLQFRKIANKLFNVGLEDHTDSYNRKMRVVFHTLRHTYCSQLCMAGVDLYSISLLVGHKNLASTKRYSKLSDAFLQGKVEEAFDF